MRVALVVPRASLVTEDRPYARLWEGLAEVQARRRLWSAPHLGLLTVAGLLPAGVEVSYLDEGLRPLEMDDPYDLVLLSPVTHQAPRAYELAWEFARRGSQVVVGGVHASVLPEEALEWTPAVAVGEAEALWPRLWEDIVHRRARGVYRAEGWADLTASPAPRYDLVAPADYRSAPIQVSRGCPHGCEFCATSRLFGPRYRRKSLGQVLREVEAATAVWGRPFLFFTDDNMFLDRRFSRELVSALRGYRLRWSAFSDISLARDRELLRLAARAGLSQVLIGFESLDARNLRGLDRRGFKARRLKDYADAVHRIQAEGVGVVGSFVLGLDHDTPDTFRRIRDFVLENALYATNLTVATPFPGTALHRRLKAEGRLTERGWREYTGFQATFTPRGMSLEELEAGLAWLYQEINRPEAIERRLLRLKALAGERLDRCAAAQAGPEAGGEGPPDGA
ncbi:MAG: B12-binding domain-containing radical SAM protein [Acetobacteraceae bacterium]|nr:B12-binding domain-containing radical SAM protein [Acetobacteraceae bacterium]